ncbi:MAG: hypothetical protein U0640_10470 [Phycisphaerales bacterium]
MFGSSVSRSSRTLQIATLAGGTLAMSLGTFSAHGAILNWASAVTGTASTAARWSPAQVPTAADQLVFNVTAGTQAYSVTFDATTASSTAMTFSQDNITTSTTAAHTTSGTVSIGAVGGQTATVTHTSGAWNVGTLRTGDVANATGQLNVSGSAADIFVTGTGGSTLIGNSGIGGLVINNAGLVDCAGTFSCGSGTGSTGAMTVTGAPAVVGGGRSSLNVHSTGTSFFGRLGDANVTISNGARVAIDGKLSMAERDVSTATLTIGGTGGLAGLLDATLNVAGDFDMAVFAGGNGGGNATTTVNAGGTLTVGGMLMLGTGTNNGTAVLNINAGADVTVGSIADGNFGTLNHNGGTLRINGGFNSAAPIPMSVSGPVGNATTLIYQNGASQTLNSSGGVSLIVGNDLGVGSFDGFLRIESGSVLNAGNGDINIGDDTGTTGLVTVTGAGSRLVANQPSDLIRVGFNGTGNLVVDSGGQVLATEIQVPASSVGGTGGLVMNNPANGGPIVTTGNLSVGNAAGLGTGAVTINQGDLNVTNPGVGVVVRDTGVLTVPESGTLNATGSINIDGGQLQVNGTAHAGVLVDVLAGGELWGTAGTGVAIVDGPVRVRSGGAVEAILGDLTMGNTTSTNAVVFDSGSSVTIGNGRTLLLRDTDTVNANGNIIMDGGTLSIAPPIDMSNAASAGNTLSGFGTINARMIWKSAVTPSGSGLVFQQRLFMNGGFNANGTAIRFASGSELIDLSSIPCTLNCKVTADAGSVIRPLTGNGDPFGTITMGDGSPTGVTLNGVLHMGTNGSLTLNDSNLVPLGSLTDMNGGTIRALNGLVLQAGRVLRGHGTIDCGTSPLNLTGGTIDPDAYFSVPDSYSGIGTFAISGTYAQGSTSTYLCEIAGFNNEFQPLNDKILCGPAALNGTLNVSLIDGYHPRLCDEFTIMQYTSRTGTWTNIVSPPGVGVGVRYEATRAVLFFNSLECNDIDFNNDGSIFDPQDIDAFLSVYSEGPCIPVEATCDDIDFNNDCSVFDPQDIDAFLSVFSEGPCIH